MPDQTPYTELLDTYLAAKSNYDYLDHPNNDRIDNFHRQAVVDEYMGAKDALDNYMMFMRTRVHTHDNMFMGTGEPSDT